jgi:Holliday junction resolvasome RuvABC ATP-dependent DNA helicase subunit
MSEMDKQIKKLFPMLFDKIVGQEAAKKKALFYLGSHLHTRIFPNAIVTAPKGQGKTTLAREIAKGLPRFTEDGKVMMEPDPKNPGKERIVRKDFVEVNCSTVKNLKQFINSVLIKYVVGKQVTVFFDEASELPKDVSMALLTILNPNPENRTVFAYEEYVCDFDFRDQTFIFATSEPQKVFHALLDRLERIDLEEYTFSDLAKIVQKGAKEVKFEDAALADISTVLRGNARAAQMMADKCKQFLRGKDKFTSKDWKQLRDHLGIYPLGLNAGEIAILRHLANTNEGTSLTCLAAKTGLTREALQRDYEMHLQRHGLMEILTTGRQITAKGRDYLSVISGGKAHCEELKNAETPAPKMKATAKVEVK